MEGAPVTMPSAPLYNRVVQIDGEDDYEYWCALSL